MAMEAVLRRMDVDATVHGFRSAFRDWAGERTHFPREIAEAALAHLVGDAVERAYRRGDALEKRRELMEGGRLSTTPKGSERPYRYCSTGQRALNRSRVAALTAFGAMPDIDDQQFPSLMQRMERTWFCGPHWIAAMELVSACTRDTPIDEAVAELRPKEGSTNRYEERHRVTVVELPTSMPWPANSVA